MAASRRIPVGLPGGTSVKFSEDVNRMLANDLWKRIGHLREFLTAKGFRQVGSNRCRGRRRGYRPQLERLETRTALTGTWSTVTNLAPTQVPYANGGTTGIGTMELLSDGTVLAFSGWIRAASEGSSTGGNSATTLNDGTAAWTTNRWTGQMVYITGGTGVGETATVQSNSATKLILTMPGWTQAIPDASSTYSIGGPANDQQVYALRPDSSGSYVNGTWSAVAPAQGSIASLIDPRYVFPANMLNDGRLLVLGGEYSTHIASQDNLHEAEIYDPVTNLWTQTADPPTGLHLGGAPTELLPDGSVLVSSIDNANTYTYNRVSNAWSSSPAIKLLRHNVPSGDTGMPKQTDVSTATTLVDSNKNWSPNQWQLQGGFKVEITDGAGAGQVRIISSNTSTQLTIDAPWNQIPDGTSRYVIASLYQEQSKEETWIKLADASILEYDIWPSVYARDHGGKNGYAQRYIPSTNTWVDASNGAPNDLSSDGPQARRFEMGPAFLLPTGKVFQVGSTGKTAIYDPSTNSWSYGPPLPVSPQGQLLADDEPGAMMPNGKILLSLEPLGSSPQYIYEFDPVTGTYTNVTPPDTIIHLSQGNGSGVLERMLVLPTGQVLYTNGTSGTEHGHVDHLAVYTPDGSPSASWKPAISSITRNSDGSFTLTGTQLNGISQGASFGDDAEMDTNYPIVKIRDQKTGNVYYARTYNWSSTGVATGNLAESTQFTLPPGLAGDPYSVSVIANGIDSSLVVVNGTNGDDTITLHGLPADPANRFEVLVNNVAQASGLWSSAAGIAINTLGGNVTVNIENTSGGAASVPVTVNLGNGRDVVNVSGTAHTLRNLKGLLTINGGSGADVLNLYDDGNNVAQNYSLDTASNASVGTIAPSTPGYLFSMIRYSHVGNVYIHGTGMAGGFLFVRNTLPNTTLHVIAGGGTPIIGYGSGTLAGILGPVSVAGRGNTLMYVYDPNTTAGNRYYVNATNIGRVGLPFITYNHVGGGVILVAGAGANDIRVANDNGQLGSFAQPVTIHGGGNSGTRLIVWDNYTTTAQIYSVNATNVQRVGSPVINYDGVGGRVILSAGTGANAIRVANDNGQLASFARPVTIVGGGNPETSLIVWDNYASAAQTYTIKDVSLQTGSGFNVSYSALKNLTLVGGSGNSTYNIESIPGNAIDGFTNVDTGNGNNTVNVSPTVENLATIVGMLTVTGGSGSNVLSMRDDNSGSTDTYDVSDTATTAGRLNSALNYTGFTGFQSLWLYVTNGSTVNNDCTSGDTLVVIYV